MFDAFLSGGNVVDSLWVFQPLIQLMRPNDETRRRDVLRATGIAAAAALAGCSGGSGDGGDSGDDGGSGDGGDEESTPTPESTSSGDSGGSSQFDGWLDGVKNFDGVADETGSDAVSVKVGVDNGDQPYGFGPAAVKVSAGTKVTWEWTGKGGSHNVVDNDGAFESELVTDEGHTFSYTFEETGTFKYYCSPHKTLGMKGVVVVE
jgi:halocyanin-like protein